MSIELMLLAVNINLVAFSAFLGISSDSFCAAGFNGRGGGGGHRSGDPVVYFRNRGGIAVEDVSR